MGSIDKLSIRGVRAFSPDEDEQALEFFHPVTVIVGANGCGKTTIIESMKYAVTGALPPGKNPGQSFVHDPKSCNQSSVKAQVKLRFHGSGGEQFVVVRSMELTQKRASMTFKSLDGVVRYRDEKTGERLSMTHKCTELDQMIPLQLGVSKAILEHVVFCHQEDASWPLMDSAMVKKRFDDIFDSSRYVKALKELGDLKKRYKAAAKDLEIEQASIKAFRETAQAVRSDLSAEETQLEQLEETLEGINKEIKVIGDRENECAAISDQVDEIKERQEELDNKHMIKLESLKTSKRHLKDDMTEKHTQRELKEMLMDFDEEMNKQLERKQELERLQQRNSREIAKYREAESGLSKQIGKVQAEQAQRDDLLHRRLKYMDEMRTKFELDFKWTQNEEDGDDDHSVSSGDRSRLTALSQAASTDTKRSLLEISDGELRVFDDGCKKKARELKQNVDTIQAQTQSDEDRLSKQLAETEARYKMHDKNREELKQKMEDAAQELKKIKLNSRKRSNISQQDLADAKESVDKMRAEYKKATDDPRRNDIQPAIRVTQDKINALKRQIAVDQETLNELRETSDAQNELTVLRDQVKVELEALSEALQDNEFDFNRFNIELPSKTLPGLEGGDESGQDLTLSIENIMETVQGKLEAAETKEEGLHADIRRTEKSLAEKRGLLNHDSRSMDRAREKVRAMEDNNNSPLRQFQRAVEEIEETENHMGSDENFAPMVLNSSDPEQVLASLTKRVEEVEKVAECDVQPRALRTVFRALRTITQASAEEHDENRMFCPCCSRELDKELAKIMNNNLKALSDPQNSSILAVVGEQAAQNRARKDQYNQWRKLIRGVAMSVMDYKRNKDTMTKLTASMTELKAAVTELETQLGGLADEKESAANDVGNLRPLLQLARGWCDDAIRVAGKKDKINTKANTLSFSMSRSTTGDKDLRTVEKELQAAIEKKEQLSNKLDSLNNEQTAMNEKITALSQRVQNAQENYMQKQARRVEEQKSDQRKAELTKNQSAWQEEVLKLDVATRELAPQLRSQKREKEVQRNHARDLVEGATKAQSEFNMDWKALRDVMSQIKALDARDVGSVEELTKEIEEQKSKIEEHQATLENLAPELKTVLKSIDYQEDHKRTIQENIRILQLQDELKKFDREKTRLQEELEGIEGHDTVSKQMEEDGARRRELNERRAELMGRRSGHVDMIRLNKRKLKSSELVNIDERHRKQNIKVTTTKATVQDLDKYAAALDRALMKYHHSKIEGINKIIRELWMLTYRGNDITGIEVVAGSSGGSSKSYNYRVVMNKGGTQLDMRGRCSAGQRVLASIVIRLALAETFCLKCGFMALDEPTVNLDYANKKGLARALAEIIASRSRQRNFQLVVITHDEDFVRMMKSEMITLTGFDMPERYFQVRREENRDGKYCSKIDSVDWDELA